MGHLKVVTLFSALALGVASNAIAENNEATTTYSAKVFVRLSSGIISNVGTSSGSTFNFGGVNLGVAYFFTDTLALGAAYKAETSFGAVPLKGFDLFGRYYFLGPGTAVSTRDSDGSRIVRQAPWAAYGGLEFSQRSFDFELDPEAVLAEDRSISGNISAGNIMAGFEYRLSRNWEANAELSYTLFPFGGNDPRVKIKWMLVSLGATYVF